MAQCGEECSSGTRLEVGRLSAGCVLSVKPVVHPRLGSTGTQKDSIAQGLMSSATKVPGAFH